MFAQMDQHCLACRYAQGVSMSNLMKQFDQDRISINQVGAVCAVNCTVRVLELDACISK